jgi:guanine deaminase
MLGKRSLMGHGIHLSAKELKVLSATETSIIHCPTSNAPLKEKGLGSGIFDFEKIEKAKIRWALGSDIGGGPFLSMFDVMRSFVDQHHKLERKDATYVKALYRSTLAGAKILECDKKLGNLDTGKEANFLVVPLPEKFAPKDPETTLKKLIEPYKKRRDKYGDLITHVFFQGERV